MEEKLKRIKLKQEENDRIHLENLEKSKLDDIDRITLGDPVAKPKKDGEGIDYSWFYRRPKMDTSTHEYATSPVLFWETPENQREVLEWPGIKYEKPSIKNEHLQSLISPPLSENNEFLSGNAVKKKQNKTLKRL